MTSISKEKFGTTKAGDEVFLYSMKNENNMKVEIINYGCTIVKCIVPDKKGNNIDVVLGYDDIEGYENGSDFFGATIGRCANRIANARFILKDNIYQLAKNDGNNHLHGGISGFDKKIWDVNIDGETLKLSYTSKDGEEMYPANLDVTVTFTLSEDNALVIDYTATTDQTTICNLTNHTYFNLNGHDSGSVENQKMQLFANEYTRSNEELIPNGEIDKVDNTPMDLRNFTIIGENINSEFDQIAKAGGFDHNWIIADSDKSLKKAACTMSDESGIMLTTYTTLPAIQFYSGNFLKGSIGKSGAIYNKHQAFCLETQYYPNAINCPNFPSTILEPNEEYKETTMYKFEIV